MARTHKNRKSFSIIDPSTNKKFEDIIEAYLSTRYITVEDFDYGYLNVKGFNYRLICDKETKQSLGLDGFARVIVSFQHRTTGLYAIARIFRFSADEPVSKN